MLGVLVAAAVWMMVAPVMAQSPGIDGKPLPAIYQSWIDQDVTYIAKPEEKAAFLALNKDAERDEFVRQFWLRRDPSPGTEKNEFKEEHYRRIAYSNVHFASKMPGWKTDRGHVYVVDGPPDEISTGTTDGIAWVSWSYKGDNLVKPKQRVFEDNCKCGEFVLRPLN